MLYCPTVCRPGRQAKAAYSLRAQLSSCRSPPLVPATCKELFQLEPLLSLKPGGRRKERGSRRPGPPTRGTFWKGYKVLLGTSQDTALWVISSCVRLGCLVLPRPSGSVTEEGEGVSFGEPSAISALLCLCFLPAPSCQTFQPLIFSRVAMTLAQMHGSAG